MLLVLLLEACSCDGYRGRRLCAQINPAFHHEKLVPMVPTIEECALRLCTLLGDAADSGAAVPVHTLLMNLALDIIGRTAFGIDLRTQTPSPHPLATALRAMLDASLSSGGAAGTPASKAQLDAVHACARPVIRERLRTAAAAAAAGDVDAYSGPRDLLGLLVTARHPETNEGMNEEQVLAEVMTFLIAGASLRCVCLCACVCIRLHRAFGSRPFECCA
jgi:cytochrome P450/NADPH-cytochrome P450 reductase